MSKEALVFIATVLPIFATLAWIITDYTKLKAEVEHNTEADKEERSQIKEDIKELFASRNKTNELLTEKIAELTGQISALTQVTTNQLNNLEKKIDEIKYERGKL